MSAMTALAIISVNFKPASTAASTNPAIKSPIAAINAVISLSKSSASSLTHSSNSLGLFPCPSFFQPMSFIGTIFRIVPVRFISTAKYDVSNSLIRPNSQVVSFTTLLNSKSITAFAKSIPSISAKLTFLIKDGILYCLFRNFLVKNLLIFLNRYLIEFLSYI